MDDEGRQQFGLFLLIALLRNVTWKRSQRKERLYLQTGHDKWEVLVAVFFHFALTTFLKKTCHFKSIERPI